MGRGLGWVTHRGPANPCHPGILCHFLVTEGKSHSSAGGPFQPLLFCDSVILCSKASPAGERPSTPEVLPIPSQIRDFSACRVIRPPQIFFTPPAPTTRAHRTQSARPGSARLCLDAESGFGHRCSTCPAPSYASTGSSTGNCVFQTLTR